ncbi:MAG: alpha-glucan family phosphorylase [Patescibacteria group bacterium]
MSILKNIPHIAYFSMEIALEDGIKNYSGGLGVLAGDILRSAADFKLPMVGVTLLSDQGYFEQTINLAGEQDESPDADYDFSLLEKLETSCWINIAADRVRIGIWRYLIKSASGGEVPVYLLDTKFSENKEEYRHLTGQLYGGDETYRLLQTIILGRGGFAALKALGYRIDKYHINEGHGAFVAVDCFLSSSAGDDQAKLAEARQACVFTTHTPLKLTHSFLPLDKVLAYQPDFPAQLSGLVINREVDMTQVALYFSGYANAVSAQHQQLAVQLFPNQTIHKVTNGIHAQTWTAPEFQALYDKYMPDWRLDNLKLAQAAEIPLVEIVRAHQTSKSRLLELIKARYSLEWQEDILTIGFGRRFAPYKRPALLFQDMDRLLRIQEKCGSLQIVYGGKAHPADDEGQGMIADIHRLINQYRDQIRLVFLEDYEMELAKIMTAGVDLWLNTPLPPNEASGTSGMKAAHNGVPQLSTLDGWWPEGYIRDKTGWAIAEARIPEAETQNERDAASLYDILEQEIVPLYYRDQAAWQEMMRATISLNASRFNTERVVREYMRDAYQIK